MIKSRKVKKAIKRVTDDRLVAVHKELIKLQEEHDMLQHEHDLEKRHHNLTKAELKRLKGSKESKSKKKGKK